MNQPLTLAGMVQGDRQNCAFEPFRGGIKIYHLVQGEHGVALLRYQPDASAPRRLETIVVLEGS